MVKDGSNYALNGSDQIGYAFTNSSDGKLNQIRDTTSSNHVDLTYNGDDLAQVKDSVGNALAITTVNHRITAISDGARSEVMVMMQP